MSCGGSLFLQAQFTSTSPLGIPVKKDTQQHARNTHHTPITIIGELPYGLILGSRGDALCCGDGPCDHPRDHPPSPQPVPAQGATNQYFLCFISFYLIYLF